MELPDGLMNKIGYGPGSVAEYMINYLSQYYDRGTSYNIKELFGAVTSEEDRLIFHVSKLLDVDVDKRLRTFEEFLNGEMFELYPQHYGFDKLLLPYRKNVSTIYSGIINWLKTIAVIISMKPIIIISSIDFFIQNTDLFVQNDDDAQLFGIACLWIFSDIYATSELTLEACTLACGDLYSAQEISDMIFRILIQKQGRILFDTIYNYLASALGAEITLILMTQYIESYILLGTPQEAAAKIIKQIKDDPLLPKTAENIYLRFENDELLNPDYYQDLI